MNLSSGIVVGQYLPGHSLLHRMDPRAKLLFVFAYMITIFLANNALTYLLFTVITLSGLFLSKVPVRMFFSGLKPVFFLILLTIIFHLFVTKGGATLVQLGPVSIDEEGVYKAVFISLRIFLLLTTAFLLTLTTSPLDLTDGLEQLLSPLRFFRVPVYELALMMSIALRFIPTLWEEALKIMKAQQARGANFTQGSTLKRIRSFMPVLIPLIIASFRRAEDLALAMEARCYRGGEGRTRLRELKYTRIDFGLLVLFILLMSSLFWLRT